MVLVKYVTPATDADIITSGVTITLNAASEIDGGLFEFIRVMI